MKQNGSLIPILLKKAMITLVCLGGIAGGVFATGIFKRQYTVAAHVLVRDSSPLQLEGDLGVQNGRVEPADFKASQIALIRTPFILTTVLRDPRVAGLSLVDEQPDPLYWLRKELSASFVEGSSVMKLSMRGSDIEQLKEILDAVCNAYIEESVAMRRQQMLERLSWLQREHQSVTDKIRSMKSEMRALSDALGATGAESEREVGRLQLASIVAREGRLREKLDALELKTALARGRQTLEGEQELTTDDETTMGQELFELEKKLLTEQLDALADKRDRLVSRVMTPVTSTDLELIKNEIDLKMDFASGMASQIALLHLKLERKPRIEQVSRATLIEQPWWFFDR